MQLESTTLVTGTAGFIGSHVVDRLLDLEHRVVGVDCFDPAYDRALKERNLAGARNHANFRFVEDDVRNVEALASLLKTEKIKTVVHLAARAGVRASVDNAFFYDQLNTYATMCVLEAMRQADCRNIVFASSSSVYGNLAGGPPTEDMDLPTPLSPYAVTKIACEHLLRCSCRLHGFNATALRLFTVYGPRQRPDMAVATFTRLLQEGKPLPLYGHGELARDMTYVDDAVSGIVSAMHNVDGFQLYNIGGGVPVSVLELSQLLAQTLGVTGTTDLLPAQPGESPNTHANITKAESMLGYAPSIALADGLVRYIDWCHKRA